MTALRWRRGSNPKPGTLWLDLGVDQFGRENFLRIRPCPESLFLNFLIEDERKPGYVIERVAKRPGSIGQSREVITWRSNQRDARKAGEEWVSEGSWESFLLSWDSRSAESSSA